MASSIFLITILRLVRLRSLLIIAGILLLRTRQVAVAPDLRLSAGSRMTKNPELIMRQPRERLACQRRLETPRLSQILEKSGPPEGIPVPKSCVSGRPHRCETQRACGKITREYATRVRHSPNTRRASLV